MNGGPSPAMRALALAIFPFRFLFIFWRAWVPWHAHGGQRTACGGWFSLLTCGSWGLTSDHQASQQSPLPAEPSRRPLVHTPSLAPGSSRLSSSHPFFCTWMRVCRACKRSHVVLALRIQVEKALEGEQLFPLCRRGVWDGRRIHLQTGTIDGLGSLTHNLCFPLCPKVKKIGG